MNPTLRALDTMIDENRGILRLRPAFVARTFYPGLDRLGLADASAGSRGSYCERWIGSCVQADNAEWVEGEGVSLVALEDGQTISLAAALEHRGDRLLGSEYAASHANRFGLLSKLLDIGEPIPWHIHANDQQARKHWNCSGKEEAYFFLDCDDRGPVPYSHIGIHPDVTREDVVAPVREWRDDRVLDLSPAYRLNIGEGFHVPTGIPHAPGTALTLELQQESDVYNFLQAISGAHTLDKSLMLRGLPDANAVLDLIDWSEAARADLYNAYHTVPVAIRQEDGVRESWVFHPSRTRRFSGKELRLAPGARYESRENGAYVLFAWQGSGTIDGARIVATDHERDELFVGAETATRAHVFHNTDDAELIAYKLFGPDVNTG